MKGVIDRFEGDKAVILIEEDGKEITVLKSDLPEKCEQNTILKIEKKNDNYQIIERDEEARKNAQQTSADLLQALRNKSKGSNYKK